MESDPTMLQAALFAYCTLQLGYAYAGTAGSSVNEHWPARGASTGSATRTSFAPEGLEDLVVECGKLADQGECERSKPYMETHCAQSCAAYKLEQDVQVLQAALGWAAHESSCWRGSAYHVMREPMQ